MDQKLENILNLALETPEEEREQTESLNVGYSAESRSWELIVKYHGSLDGLREQNIVVEELIAGYAILTVPETLVDTVSETPEIEYVEKPKRFYYQQTDPDGASCFPPVTRRTPSRASSLTSRSTPTPPGSRATPRPSCSSSFTESG